jgi:hypothetical protein
MKLNATQPEKDYLIAEGKLGSHLRTRSVTLITARSAFKLHGSKTIIGRIILNVFSTSKSSISKMDAGSLTIIMKIEWPPKLQNAVSTLEI